MSLRYLTAGESHGKALIGIIEGLPAGMEIDQDQLTRHMQARKAGYGRGSRQKIETDSVEIISGVRFGKTTGAPISIMIENKDYKNWKDIMSVFGESQALKEVKVPRPGHADIVGGIKYGYSDLRDALERASARETAMRVALGYFAKTFLEQFDISIFSRVIRIGEVEDKTTFKFEKENIERIQKSPVRCLDTKAENQMIEAIDIDKKKQDSLGGEFEVVAFNLPIGLGSYGQWDKKIEAKIGASFLSLNSVKAVEMGLGKESARLCGSQVHDEMSWENGLKFSSNNCGGVLAGVSNGSPLVVRASMKPISTLMQPLQSFDWSSKEPKMAHVERADYCAVPAGSIIGESLMALSLVDIFLEKFGGDSIAEILPRVKAWREQKF